MKKKIALILSLAAISSAIVGCSANAAVENSEADNTEKAALYVNFLIK